MFKEIEEEQVVKKNNHNYNYQPSKSKLVCAQTKSGILASCNPKLCAERVLLNKIIINTKKKGKSVNLHNIYKEMNKIEVWRYKRDGTPGSSIPCLGCRIKLNQLNICLFCYNDYGEIIKSNILDLEKKAVVTNADKIKWNFSI